MTEYRTILIDPPWKLALAGKYSDPRNQRPARLPYPTMSLAEIAALPIATLAARQVMRDHWRRLTHVR